MDASTTCVDSTRRYIPEIDGLRAIAVLAVIFYHARSTLLPGGFTGVDVFFVISGFVVSASLARDKTKKLLEFAKHFYARRVVRIYPALVVCLVLTGILSTLFIPVSWLSSTSSITGKYAFWGLGNYALTISSDGYFSPRVEFNPFAHTWSLAVEEQFYLLFPLIFYIWLKGQGKKSFGSFIANWLLPIILMVSFGWSCFETRTAHDAAYYLLPSRFWELACGAVLFMLHTKGKLPARSKNTSTLWLVVGLVLICLGFLLSRQENFPFPWSLLPVGGTLFVIAGAITAPENDAKPSRFLAGRAMGYIGKISYSLYLWHWPVFSIFHWTVGLESVPYIAAAITITAVLSMISYHFVETPTRKVRSIITRPDWQVLTASAAVVGSLFFLTCFIFDKQPNISLSRTKDLVNWYPYAWKGSVSTDNSHPHRLMGNHTLFAAGDSHCSAYNTMFRLVYEEFGLHISEFSKGGYPICNLTDVSTGDQMKNTNNILYSIEKVAKPGDIVFLASLKGARLCGQYGKLHSKETLLEQEKKFEETGQLAQALQEADTILTRLENDRLLVIIDAPKPIFQSPPFRCSDWFNENNPICNDGFTLDRNYLLAYRQPYMDELNILAMRHKNLIIWDPFPYLCPSGTCSAFDGNKPLFFDGDHLSAHGNRVIFPSFCKLLVRILGMSY